MSDQEKRRCPISLRIWHIIGIYKIIIGPAIYYNSSAYVNVSEPMSTPSAYFTPSAYTTPYVYTTPSAYNTPVPTATFNQSEMPKPSNGTSKNLTDSDAVAPLEIVLPDDGYYYYIVLKDSTTEKKSFHPFLSPGVTYETNVPLGNYNIYDCCGSKWYGEKYLFGPEKSDDILDFTEDSSGYSGYTIELETTTYGNMDTQTIVSQNLQVNKVSLYRP